MSIEETNNTNDTEKLDSPETESTLEIAKAFRNTADFRARAAKDPMKAEDWMNHMYKTDERYQGNERWLEDRQRELLELYCQNKSEASAKRVIEDTKNHHSQTGRIKKYEKYFGAYDGLRLKQEIEPDKEGEPIVDSTSFRQALLEKRFDEAEAWLGDPNTIQKYTKYPKVLEDRRRELEEAKYAHAREIQ